LIVSEILDVPGKTETHLSKTTLATAMAAGGSTGLAPASLTLVQAPHCKPSTIGYDSTWNHPVLCRLLGICSDIMGVDHVAATSYRVSHRAIVA